ncbi:glycosyltransferase [Sphingomonas sp.]|uniref:glycosyltransferase n=1 Tax=Sphingomonas sp. TaxID=28214 RepID=UPI0025DFC886|nr:glycosyltransferase [Sphingomonas sp.]
MTDAVAIVIPTLDEATTLPRLARLLAALDPPPDEVVVVDGGSSDGSAAIARELGLSVIEHHEQGRSRQINRGVDWVASPIVCVLHADTQPPDDMIAVIRRTLADPKVALAGFTPLLSGPDKVRWVTSFHNWIKTWYAPLLFRPHFFFRGVRLLFGDHAMFFRRADFLAVGGCDPGMSVMEEADLCVKMARFGRVRLVNRVILTSDRRVAAWGEWKANWTYLTVGIRWAMGLRDRLGDLYPHIR